MDRLPVGLNTIKLPIIITALDYARLSKDRNKLSENVKIQHRENQGFIEEQSWEHGGSFEDNDISASRYGTKKRADYARLIETIKNWPDRDDAAVKLVIVVTEMPRLYRQIKELIPLIELAEHTKLSGIWTTDGEGYDLSTPEGIHRAIGAVNNAELESRRASKRQLRKKRALVEQGRWIGGRRRYGYEGAIKDQYGNTINKDRINTALVPDEVAHWRDWYQRLVSGEAELSIVRDNNRRGILSTNDGQWTIGNFKRMMTNEAYVIFDADGHPADCPCLTNPPGSGTLVHSTSGVKHRARWPGLVTKQEYEVLRSRLQETSTYWGHGRTRTRGRKYLLSGIAVCGGAYQGKPCPGVMYGNGRVLRSGTYQRRYCCKSHSNQGERVACGKVFRDRDALDEFVTEAVLFRLDTPDIARALASEDEGDHADELVRKLAAQRNRRDLIKRQYGRGEIESLEEYKVMRAEADKAIDELQAELGKLRADRAIKVLPADGKLHEAWDQADIEWRRSVIELLVEKVVVHPGHPGAKQWHGHRFDPDRIEIMWRH